MVSLIAAVDNSFGIGKDGTIPWVAHYDKDFFAKMTYGFTIIMGKNTYRSLPKYLNNRTHIVVSSTPLHDPNIQQVQSVKEAIDKSGTTTYVIGGENIYRDALQYATHIYLTHIFGKFECDTFFPTLSWRWSITNWSEIHHDDTVNCRFLTITKNSKKVPDEKEYLDLLTNVYINGELKNDRTKTGTFTLFSNMMKFDLSDGYIPLLTTKRVPFRIVLEELLWFLRGETNAKPLQEKGVHIWDRNSTREFLDNRGLTSYPEGELGPIYGYQWRNFNGSGYDQIAQLEEQLKTDPKSRRMVVSAWNPQQLHEMALPPCHMLFQVYVSNDNRLHMRVDQRSADMFLGIPFNIASYGTLCVILAKRNGYYPGTLTLMTGDTHIYANHLQAVEEQLSREARMAPRIEVNDDIRFKPINELSTKDFNIIGYFPAPTISAKMSA